MSDWPDRVTPRDLAKRLGVGGSRPDRTVRAWLRSIHPEHPRYERWTFSPVEADSLVRRWHEK
jgi:hypothetical protein